MVATAAAEFKDKIKKLKEDVERTGGVYGSSELALMEDIGTNVFYYVDSMISFSFLLSFIYVCTEFLMRNTYNISLLPHCDLTHNCDLEHHVIHRNVTEIALD